MTAIELAQVLHARKTGRGKWVARCPAHRDRNPSLCIAEGKKVPVVLRCMSQGCETKDILAAVGLSWDALFDGKPTPEIRQRVDRQQRLEKLRRRLGLVRMAAEGLLGESSDWWPRPIYDRQEDGSFALAKQKTREHQEFMRGIFEEAERQLGGKKSRKWLQQAEIGILKEIEQLEKALCLR